MSTTRVTKTVISAVMLLMISVNSCTCFCKKGEGNVISKKLELPAFESIDIDGHAGVFLEQASQSSIEIMIDSNLYQYLTAEVSGKKLKIDEKKCFESITEFKIFIKTDKLVELIVDGNVKVKGDSTITSDNLYISNQGTGDIRLNLDVNDLEVRTSGSGLTTLTGRVLDLDTKVTGAGSFDGSALHAKNAKVTVADAGSSKIDVSEKFSGDVSGSGSITYSGNPKKVNTDITGTGTIQSK